MVLSKSPGDWSSRVRRRIRAGFAEHEISATDAARQLGWSQSYMSHRLTGRRTFDLDDIQRIADLLGIAPSDLTVDREQVAA